MDSFTSSFSLSLLILCTLLLLHSYNLHSSSSLIPSSFSLHRFQPSYHNFTGKTTADQIQVKGKGKARRRVEMELERARTGIKKAARIPDSNGKIYWNTFAFQQSYKEMEKSFKIYVYKEGEVPLVHHGPCKNVYSIEGMLIHDLQFGNRFLTSDPEEAHVFFLPFSVVMMVSFIYTPLTYDLAPLKRFVSDYIRVVSSNHPFWNRTLGADHFFLSCHDWAPEASRANPYLYNTTIRVLCNANTSEGFNPAKDVTLPEVNFKEGTEGGTAGGKSAVERSILAFFAGRNHGEIRTWLFKHWKRDRNSSSPSDIQVYEQQPNDLSLPYSEMMRNSKYCLCPSGYEVASPRIVEAIHSECVPVIISDHYVLPFSDVLNWTTFSVNLPPSEIPNLKGVLESIPLARYLEMQERVKEVRRHFEMNEPSKPYDMFHMILHSIWLRRLNLQLPQYL